MMSPIKTWCGAPILDVSPGTFSIKLLCALITLLAISWAHAQDESSSGTVDLQNISFSALPGDRVQIKLGMSGPPTQPISFTIDNPARIALDFANTLVKTAKNQPVGVGLVQSISAVEAKDRTRVVLNLSQLTAYEIRIQGNDVFLTLESTPGSGTTTTALQDSTPAATAPVKIGTGERTLDNIDFRRGDKSEGRVVVALADPATGVDIREEGGKIIVDFLNSSLPERLERRLDVTDFATPVQTIETSAKGNNVRMVISPSGEYSHLAYQAGNTFTVEVKPLTKQEKEAELKDKFTYTGEKLSLNFQNIEVRAVLQLIADFTGLNIITSDTVQGNLTLRLKNVPWDQALDIILKSKGLGMRQVGNVIQIAPVEEIAAREKLELESQKQVAELAPLRSEFIRINYAKAADLAALLKAKENSLLSARGNVTVDERTNTLLVQDTADQLADVRKLVTTLDIAQQQVLIESRIVVADDNFSKDLGVRFGVTRKSQDLAVTGTLEGTTDLINGDPLGLGDSLNVNLPASPTAGTAGSIALALAKLPFGNLLELELSALQQENRGEVISNPRVVTANQKEARIEQGVEIPFLEASSSGAATISFKDAVLRLLVTPQITPDARVIMDLTVNQDTVGELVQLLGSAVPSINTREVSTQVLVDNGETVVLGGVYERESRNTSDRIPFFGDLPYVGFLFKNTQKTDIKRELLIFVTPKILDENLAVN
jgi:type IV pilus assembly protein PilQ